MAVVEAVEGTEEIDSGGRKIHDEMRDCLRDGDCYGAGDRVRPFGAA
jgi:hypothetical protein